MRPQRPAIRPVLQQHYSVVHFAWCRGHIHFTQQNRAHVLFTDESRFHLDNSDGRSRVYHRVDELFDVSCVTEQCLFGRGSIMVWGGISSRGRTALVVVDGTQASDTVTQSYGPMFFHLCSNIMPCCNRITLARMSCGSSPTSPSRTMLMCCPGLQCHQIYCLRARLG